MLDKFAAWIFRHRTALVIGFAALTGVMAVFASQLRVDASFNKSLPLEHPYIRTFTKYQSEFGGANRVLVALIVRTGDIFTAPFFTELKRATDEVTFLPAVDRTQVQSLFTPNVRYIEVVEDGFSGGNVIPADFTPSPDNFARVRENILKSGKLGQLVANDFTGAIISAQLLEIDPRTGEKIDYIRVSAGLEAIRQRIESQGGQVRYSAYGYHGTEILIGETYQWQTYSNYTQGYAKMRLERIAHRGRARRAAFDQLRATRQSLGTRAVVGMEGQNRAKARKCCQSMRQDRHARDKLPLLGQIAAGAGAASGCCDDCRYAHAGSFSLV